MSNKREKTIVSQFTEIEAILRENGHTDLANFMVERIAKQTAQNSKSGTSTKSTENKALAEKVFDEMEAGVGYTATQIYNMGIEGITSASKATVVLKYLIEDGRVVNTKEKGISTYKAI